MSCPPGGSCPGRKYSRDIGLVLGGTGGTRSIPPSSPSIVVVVATRYYILEGFGGCRMVLETPKKCCERVYLLIFNPTKLNRKISECLKHQQYK